MAGEPVHERALFAAALVDTEPHAERAAVGVHPGTLRVSIGIEDAADLIDDLARALAAASDVSVAVVA